MNLTQTAFPGLDSQIAKVFKPFRFPPTSHEYKVQPLREVPLDASSELCDAPEKCADYWRKHITSHPYFNREAECMVAILVNTRRRIKGHYFVSVGTGDTLLASATAIYRLAVMTSASGLIIMHNHPSGDPSPSEADIKVTRDLIRAGQTLKIELLDHIVIGYPTPERSRDFCSLNELGYFFH